MLYADIAIVSSDALDEMQRRGQKRERRQYTTALAVNLALNAGWSWLFFNRRLLGTSAIAAAVLAASSADLSRRAAAVRGMRAAPLAVYPMWCGFATVLPAMSGFSTDAHDDEAPSPSRLVSSAW